MDTLRCPGGLPRPDGSTCPAYPGQHYDHDLRDRIAEAIRRYPNTDAKWWIGPEAVLGVVEDYLDPAGGRDGEEPAAPRPASGPVVEV